MPYYQRMVEEMTAHGIDVKTLRETSGKRGRDSRRLRTTRQYRTSIGYRGTVLERRGFGPAWSVTENCGHGDSHDPGATDGRR